MVNDNMLKEFREFIAKGNMLDLAVGIIIGAAFTGIIDSLVKDLINPILGLFGTTNFENMKLVLKETVDAKGNPSQVTFNYGSFVSHVINFVIVAFVVFLIVKAANRFRKKEEAAPAAPAEDVVLLTEIRDLLAKKA